MSRNFLEALRRWLADGAEVVRMSLPDGTEVPMGVRSRRVTFERALRSAALGQPGFAVRRGHVDGVTRRHGRAAGILVDGAEFAADLVIDASGRAGRSTRSLRPPATSGGPCGIAGVDRRSGLHQGADPGPLANPIAWQADLPGYQVIVFIHERGIFSVLLVRPAADRDLCQLRHEAAFTAACQAIPGLSDWTDPGRARPVTPVLPGGPLLNAYRGQPRDTTGGWRCRVWSSSATPWPPPPRPSAAVVTTTLLQAGHLLKLIDEHGA